MSLFLTALLILLSAFLFILVVVRVPASPSKGIFAGLLANNIIVGVILLMILL